MVAILQIVRSEHMAAGDPVAEISKKQIVDSLLVPVAPKKMKGREECIEMLKKAVTILMLSAEATASADDEC
jgi:hypothetical protein